MKTMKIRKKLSPFKLVWLICLSSSFPFILEAQENPLQLYGELYTDFRFRLENGDWSWNENRLDLQLDKRFADKARFHSEIWFRSFGFPVINQAEQLFNKDETSPYNIDLREAYVELYGLFTKDLDMKIGRQRIAWGTADRLNPTDNLNAYDLEDIWDFGRHNGSDAIRATYYLGDFYLEADYILFFRPATLPRGDLSSVLMSSFPISLPPGFFINDMSDSIAMPSGNLAESATFGLKFGGYTGLFDFSASYIYGRDGFPMPYYNRITIEDLNTGALSVRSYMSFPRYHIFGADVAGNIGSVGVWAEAAAFLPKEEVVMTSQVIEFSVPPTDTVLLGKKPFFKAVAGADYTIRGGHYFNFQYLHGFVHERGASELNDYFVLAYEKMLFNDKLRIRPLTMAFVVDEWRDVPENYALIYSPFIDYMPNSNTEISLGTRLIWGKGNNPFATLKDKDEFVFSVRFKF